MSQTQPPAVAGAVGFKHDSECYQLVPATDQPLDQRGGSERFAASLLQFFCQICRRTCKQFVPAEKFSEKNNELIPRLWLRGNAGREQATNVGIPIELQRQLPVLNVPDSY